MNHLKTNASNFGRQIGNMEEKINLICSRKNSIGNQVIQEIEWNEKHFSRKIS